VERGRAARYGEFAAGSGVDEMKRWISAPELAKCDALDRGSGGAIGDLLASVMSFGVVIIGKIGLRVRALALSAESQLE
jgi:hypothetical protein